MMHFHSMFSIQLIALSLGVGLLILIKNQSKVKDVWPIYVAWFVIGLSAISIICSAFYSVKYWKYGSSMRHERMMKRMDDKGREYMNQNMEKKAETVTENNAIK